MLVREQVLLKPETIALIEKEATEKSIKKSTVMRQRLEASYLPQYLFNLPDQSICEHDWKIANFPCNPQIKQICIKCDAKIVENDRS